MGPGATVGAMRVGLYFDLRNPPAWARPWPDFYARSLDLMAEAERLGIDSIWLSEHHQFDDGYLPQPLTMAAAVAARTERVRIATAILIAPLRAAAQIAEEAAVVDVLSNGRLTLGFGAGYVNWEFDLFGADRSRRYTATDDRVRDVSRLLGPDGTITPPSVQRPVPIWLGYQGPQGARRAGRLGVGLLSLDPDLLSPYRAGLADGGHDPGSARMAGLLNLLVADDPDEAFERVLPHLCWQLNTYRRGAADGSGRVPSEVTPDKIRANRDKHSILQPLHVLTPDDAAAHIRSVTEGLPVEEVYCWASIAGMDDDLVERHVEALSTTVREAVADL